MSSVTNVSTGTTSDALRGRTGIEIELAFILAALTGAVLLVSPLAAFATSGFLLINLGRNTPVGARHILAVIIAIALAMMTGARPLEADASNDIEGYYAIYQSLAEGELGELVHFGGGFEVALPLLMYLCTVLLPPLSVNGLMFCFALTGSLLMVVWVEKTFYADKSRQAPALLGICILMLNLYFATQLSRQFLSLMVMLYAFTAVGRTRQAVYLVIAAAFHLTAIPFFAIYLLARRGWFGWLAIVAAALLLRLYFAQILVAFDVLPEAAAEKLVYYVDNLDESSSSDIGSLRMVFLLGAISLAALVASRFRPTVSTRPWLSIPWVTAIVHYLLLPVPLASLRTTLMVHSVIPGLIAHKMLRGRAGALLATVLNVLLIYKVTTFAMAENGANLRSSLAMVREFLL